MKKLDPSLPQTGTPEYLRNWRRKNRAHFLEWARNHYRTNRGRIRAAKQKYERRNTSSEIARQRKRIENLTDGYIIKVLNAGGNFEPTRDDIVVKRKFIQAIRSQRNLATLIYGSRIQH